MNKYFNCIKNPKYSKNKLEEDLIWPTKQISDADIIKTFKELVKYYEKNRVNENIVVAHGDFWRGNIEKDLTGKIWIFDWVFSRKRPFIWDMANYFLVEYFYTRKINQYLFLKAKKKYLGAFKINNEAFLKKMDEFIEIYKKERSSSQKHIINSFHKKIKRLTL